jgi:hypothetical protein
MATTTNYSWTTPDDSALVKDGASAIRSLGTSIDTTTKNLNPSTTLGDIEYRSSTANTNTRLGIGTTGQVLTVSGGVPAWATASSGGMTLISETTASAISSLDLTSISGSYKSLLFVWHGISHSGSGSAFSMRFNNDSGNNYSTSSTQTENSSASISGGNSDQMVNAVFGSNITGSTLFEYAQGFIQIDNYASSTKLKNYWGQFCYQNLGSNNRFITFKGTYNSTSAITQLNIFRTTGSATFSNATNTSIRLYGLS